MVRIFTGEKRPCPLGLILLDSFFRSAHGSHIGNVRLEANKPTQLPIDSAFHFGASSRIYTLRAKPKNAKKDSLHDSESVHLTLPESEYEVDVSVEL